MRVLPLLLIVIAAVPPRVSIMDIQGSGHTSPYAGDSVATSGIVTAVAGNGFYVQDASGDGDPATSDAVFAYTGSAPTVATGDSVVIAGVVHEYRPGNDRRNLTVTELDHPAVTVASRGNAPPAAVRVGHHGRLPPTEVIDDDALTAFEPALDGIDFFESLEGMRVFVPGAVSVSVTNRYGEIWVVADGGAGATGMNARGGITISGGDFNPERIQIDDALLAGRSPRVEVGDRLGDITGVVSYSFGNFEVLPSTLDPPLPAAGSRETTLLDAGARELTVAAFNVENLNRRDNERLAMLGQLIAGNLGAPDVVVLEEIQDDSGESNDGTVSAAGLWGDVIAAVALAGGPAYDFREVAPEDGADGGAPGANIRVGILFQPARLRVVDRGTAGPEDAVEVVDTGNGPVVSPSPGRVDPLNDAWRYTRKPLAVEMIFAGHRVFLVGCHFSSRSGSSPLFGAVQPPLVGRADKRVEQARVVQAFVSALLDIDPGARVVVLGDFNDFQFSEALGVLCGPLVDLTERLAREERYTYNYEGNSQALDHILVSPALATGAGVDVVHVCADFDESVSDHDPVTARLSFAPGPAQTPEVPLIVRPNPFTTTTRLACAAKTDRPVDAALFDVTGRRVRTLQLHRPSGGLHEVVWDGRDDRGRSVPSGVYILRVAAPERAFTAKVVRLK